MKKIFHDLYYGRLAPSERGEPQDPELTLIDQKISDLLVHFKSTLPPGEWGRFEELESLYMKSSTIEEMDAFAYGLSMGISLMIGVFDFDLQETFYTKNHAVS